MKQMLYNKRYSGILWAIVIACVFVILSLLGLQIFGGTSWYVFSSILRFVFGFYILTVIEKLYGISAKTVLRTEGAKKALIAGSGFILYFIYFLITWCSGVRAAKEITIGLLLSRVILQQIATGFYEELNYRFLILEGYFHGLQTVKRRILYAFVSFLLFGAVHVVDGWSIYRFLQTGLIGFAFAVMYLKSGNILVPMILHFLYDVFASLTSYLEWNNSVLFTSLNGNSHFALLVMLVISVIMLLKKDDADQPEFDALSPA